MSLPINKLAWMAGVIDIKGRIQRKNNKTRASQQIVLVIETRELAITRELGSLTGIKVEELEKRDMKEWMRRGCQEHCPEPHVHVTATDWPHIMPKMGRWAVSGSALAIVIYNILPYSSSDKDLLKVMQECLDNAILTGQGRGATIKSIARLAEMGWRLPPKFINVLEDNKYD